MRGLDISSHNKGINFNSIKNNGFEFLILRGGYTGWGTGVSYYKDTEFEYFYKQANSKGLHVGCYWYSCANDYAKGVAEAKFLYENCLKGKQFEFPIYIDVEEEHRQLNQRKGVTDAIIGFCEYLENLGYYVGIYANNDWFNNQIQTSRLTAYDKWLAWWRNTKPNFNFGAFGLWQNSSTFKLNGMYVDTDESYKDYPTIMRQYNLNGFNNEEHKEESKQETPTENKEDKKQELDNKINNMDLLTLVKMTIRGDFGNGAKRREILGNRYNEVQNQVNLNIKNKNTNWDTIKLY